MKKRLALALCFSIVLTVLVSCKPSKDTATIGTSSGGSTSSKTSSLNSSKTESKSESAVSSQALSQAASQSVSKAASQAPVVSQPSVATGPQIDSDVWNVRLPDFASANNDAIAAGDKVGFIGDSITHGSAGISYYAMFMTYMATRYPDKKIEAYNFGRSGGSTGDVNTRYPFDMGEFTFNKAFILMGMNDRSTATATYEQRMGALMDTLKSKNIKTMLLSTTIYDDQRDSSSNTDNTSTSNLTKISDSIKKMAQERGLSFTNLYKSLRDCNTTLLAKTPSLGVINTDRIHPNETGHYIMMYNIMRNLNMSGEVATVVINGSNASVSKASNCTVDSARYIGANLHFNYQAKALPLPATNGYKTIMNNGLFDLEGNINREIISVTGLAAGNYDLEAGGTVLGTYTAAQLAAGVNIAGMASAPGQKKAVKVNSIVNTISSKETKIRDMKLAEYDGRIKGGKTTVEDIKQWLRDNRASAYNAYIQGLYDTYINEIDKLPTYRNDINTYREKLYKENKPDIYEIRIVKK